MTPKVPARNRRDYLLATVLIIVVGLASRRFPAFLGKYPGDVLWALMVFCGWGVFLPKAPGARIAILTLAVSFAVEFLKMCQTPWLVSVRQSTVGHLVFGHIFSWQNLIAYAIGAGLGFLGDYLCLLRRD